MPQFVVARLFGFVGSLLVASIAIFLALHVLGGDVASAILGDRGSPEAAAALREQLGLNVPLWDQYLSWLGGMVTGDFGDSYATGTAVGPQILDRLAVTVPLAVFSMLLGMAIAIPAGAYAALHDRSFGGLAVSVGSQIGISVPVFWFGLLLSTLFAVELGWLPSGGFTSWTVNPLDALASLVLPTIALGVGLGAILTRYVRSATLDAVREDYFRTALAKGLTRREALMRHGLRNAAIPLVTVLAIQFGTLMGGVIVIENVFFLPGLGRMIVTAVEQRDLMLVQSTAMVLTAMVLAINLIVDLSYGLLDPRMRAHR
jgi:peptide/nickel transport system permease protein